MGADERMSMSQGEIFFVFLILDKSSRQQEEIIARLDGRFRVTGYGRSVHQKNRVEI